MNFKLLMALFLGLLLLTNNTVYCQEDDGDEEVQQQTQESNDDIEVIEEKDAENLSQQGFQKFELKQDGELSMEEQLAQLQAQMEMQQQHSKNMYAICTILSNGSINSKSEIYKPLIQGSTDGQTLYKKIEAEHISTCMEKVDYEQAQKLAEEMNGGSFDAANWGQIFMELTPERYRDPNFSLELTEAEIRANQQAEELKQEWQKMQADQADPEELENIRQFQEQQNLVNNFEPKIFNMSVKDISGFTKVLILLGAAGIFGGIIYLGFREIQKEQNTVQPKKKSKKNKRE